MIKLVEIRDRGTLIAAIATNVSTLGESDGGMRLLRRCGFNPDASPQVLLSKCADGSGHVDPYDWGDRTMTAAHLALIAFWGQLPPEVLLDVEALLGETDAPKSGYLPAFSDRLPVPK